jgi:hypothetical protein
MRIARQWVQGRLCGVNRAGLSIIEISLAFGDDLDLVRAGSGTGLLNSLKRVHHCFEDGQQGLCLGKTGLADAAGDTCFRSVLGASVRRTVGASLTGRAERRKNIPAGECHPARLFV